MANPAPGFLKHANYQVTVAPLGKTLRVEVDGNTVATSERAILVTETKHRPVWYVPFADLDVGLLQSTDTQTYCPFKGYASYWSIVLLTRTIEDAIWAYLEPYDECATLAGYASFYTNKVDVVIDGELANRDGPGFIR